MKGTLEKFISINYCDVKNNNISSRAKMLYGCIRFLSEKNGYCFATNKYFAKEFGVCIRTITRMITQLKNEKYITTEYIKNDMGNFVRVICPLCRNPQTILSKNHRQGCQKSIDTFVEHNIQDNRRNIHKGGKYSEWD